MTRILATAFLIMILAGWCFADGWSRFRGAAGGGVARSEIPITWSETENLAWKTELPGKGSSSPVVHGDLIFLTTYSGYGLSRVQMGKQEDLRLHVVCLSLFDGELLWEKSIDAAAEEQSAGTRVLDHGYATPTPCVDEKNVYASFGPSGVVAFSHRGEMLWRRSVGTKTAGFGAAASPIQHGDLVIMNASIEDGAIYGLEKATGEVRWRADEIDRAWTTPTVVSLPNGSHELIVNQKGSILGLDPATGERLWFCDAIRDYIVPCAVTDGELIYCSGGRSNKTFVVKPGGRGDVSESHLVWDVPLGANVTSPLIHDGFLYWSHDKGIALCLRASNGEQMFRERLSARGRIYASIVCDGKKLFLTTRGRRCIGLGCCPGIQRVGRQQTRIS